MIPLGLIFLVLTLPALILALIDRFLWPSLILGFVGLVAFAYFMERTPRRVLITDLYVCIGMYALHVAR